MTTQNEQLNQSEAISYLMHEVRLVDKKIYDPQLIEHAFQQALNSGQIGFFILDCAVAYSDAKSSGIGKIPSKTQKKVLEKSSVVTKSTSLSYLASTINHVGVQSNFWTFIGDDDYKYSVTPEYGIDNKDVKTSLLNQVNWIKSALEQKLKGLNAEINVSGWLEQEKKFQEIEQFRTKVYQTVTDLHYHGRLPQNIAQRFKVFHDFRKDLLKRSYYFNFDQDLVLRLALEELTSLITQGAYAASVIRASYPGMPLIFLNTFPDHEMQVLEDDVLRFGRVLNPTLPQYGTIHLDNTRLLPHYNLQNQ